MGMFGPLRVRGEVVYVGGHDDFDRIGGQVRSHIAAIDVSTGLATPWDPNVNPNRIGAIFALLAEGGDCLCRRRFQYY